MQVKAIKTRIFKEKESIYDFIDEHVKPNNNSILVITSKIVALSEGRVIERGSDTQKNEIIKKESSFALPTKYTWLTIKDGMLMASAGIDESNAQGKLIMLPRNSFKAAQQIRNYCIKKYRLKNFGIIITDSRCLPLRIGIIGTALGYAGFKGVKDYRGTKDIFGRIYKITRVDVADSLATAAVYCMGEGREQQPLAVISDPNVSWCQKVNKKALIIDPRDDMFAPLFKNIKL